MRKKVSVIGGGNVGASCACYLAELNLADVVLVDIVEGLAAGKALDMTEGGPVRSFDVELVGSQDLDAIAGSDVVVLTAGVPRKPGMSRMDLLAVNQKIVASSCEKIKALAPNAFVIVVTNPLDVMCWVAKEVTGFPRERVMGMAGILDTSRFRAFLAKELNVSVTNVSALVLGGHGDDMVPMTRLANVAGIPITELLPAEKIEAIVKRTRGAGAEIVGLLKFGSAYYSPASSAVQMVEAILLDQKRIVPAAAYLDGEYGWNGIYLGVPVKLGAGGVEQIIQIHMNADEKAELDKSAASVKSGIEDLKAAMTQG